MAPLKVLICGGGISGPALAFWLAKSGHNITIVERFPTLRASGQQVDLRGHGIEVMKLMGLEDVFRSKKIEEEGLQFVDGNGKQMAFFPVNKSGHGMQSFTTDFEIMRGDLCQILHDVTKDSIKYIFGEYVKSFEQDSESVTVQFSNGDKDQFDLLVGADGQSSRTRKMMLHPSVPDPFHFLGLYLAYFTIPRQEGDWYRATLFHAPGRRVVFTRRHAADAIQTYLGYCGFSEKLHHTRKGKPDTKEQKSAWAELMRGSGWQTNKIIQALQNETTANDFYSQQVGQVKMNTWSQGRVVLLGDAAYCPSPITGMGTTSGLVGAYVLAGEITKFCAPSGQTHHSLLVAALESYERQFRPFINQAQKLSPGMPRLAIPQTKWGITVLHFLMWLAVFLRFDVVAEWFLGENIKWEMPIYAELGLAVENEWGNVGYKKTR